MGRNLGPNVRFFKVTIYWVLESGVHWSWRRNVQEFPINESNRNHIFRNDGLDMPFHKVSGTEWRHFQGPLAFIPHTNTHQEGLPWKILASSWWRHPCLDYTIWDTIKQTHHLLGSLSSSAQPELNALGSMKRPFLHLTLLSPFLSS
jgi:hypothetical protein